MKEIALKAIEHLTEKHNPEFIILYGSLVRGDFTEESDIDVACFCKDPAVSKDVRIFQGKKLDCWIYPISAIEPNNKEFIRFVGGKVLLDKNGTGKQFVDNVTRFFETGPEPMKDDAKEHLIEWSKNMLLRANSNSIEARYRRTWLPCSLLEIYFELRDQWYLGSKQSFAWLKQNDVSTYRLFQDAFTDPTDLRILNKLVKATIPTEIYDKHEHSTSP